MTDCPWDLNGDGVVDDIDFEIFKLAYPSSIGDANWNPACDFNGDGVVDDIDFVELAGHYGPCPGVTPPPTVITCNSPTPNFSSGCALLLHYDADKDGVITRDDTRDANNDESSGIITREEREFVFDAYIAGSIDALCLGCYTGTTPPPNMETRTMALTEGPHTIQISLSGYDTLNATINVSSTGVTCTVGPCNTQGPPGVTTSGWTVTTYLKAGTVTSDVCSWVDSIGGWQNLQWASHVLEAYYVYIGAAGHSVGFSPVTWDDVLGLYYYYINDPTAGNGKIGCGT